MYFRFDFLFIFFLYLSFMFQLLRDVEHIIRTMKDEDLIVSEVHTGDTPLHLAAKSGQYHLVHLLLQRNANPLFKNRFGLLPIEYALRDFAYTDDYTEYGDVKQSDMIGAAIMKSMPNYRYELFINSL